MRYGERRPGAGVGRTRSRAPAAREYKNRCRDRVSCEEKDGGEAVTTLTNDALLEQLCETYGIAASEEIYLFAGASTAQGAGPVKGQLHRIVVNNVAGAALTLKSVLSNDAPSFVWLVNDGAQSANIFPFVGEKMNGTLNASQALASAQAVLLMREPKSIRMNSSHT